VVVLLGVGGAWQAHGVSEARPATDDDISPLAASLARAFDDDPVMAWLFGDDAHRRGSRLRRFFGHEAKRHRRHGEVLTTPDRAGASFWSPPDGWRTSTTDLLRAMPLIGLAVGPRLPRAVRGYELIDAAHPRAPHWYLAVVGTDPAAQGRGVGASLLRPVLDRCDRAGLGAYLESSKERNIPYYQRFGFMVTGEIPLPSGPTLWPMWRAPQDQDQGHDQDQDGPHDG
jgi:ribosomal protein S18 acetylase RimI-like enzyme